MYLDWFCLLIRLHFLAFFFYSKLCYPLSHASSLCLRCIAVHQSVTKSAFIPPSIEAILPYFSVASFPELGSDMTQ